MNLLPLPSRFVRVLLAGAVLFLAGCSSMPRATVDALGAVPELPGMSFALVPDPAELPSDPIFLDAASLTREHLLMFGFVEVPESASPEVVITIAWRVGAPQAVVRTEREPRARLPSQDGSITPAESLHEFPHGPMTRGVSTPAPLSTHVRFQHKLSLTLVGRSGGAGHVRELWRVSATVVDSHPALERHLPSLVDAAFQRIAPVGTASPAKTQTYAAR